MILSISAKFLASHMNSAERELPRLRHYATNPAGRNSPVCTLCHPSRRMAGSNTSLRLEFAATHKKRGICSRFNMPLHKPS